MAQETKKQNKPKKEPKTKQDVKQTKPVVEEKVKEQPPATEPPVVECVDNELLSQTVLQFSNLSTLIQDIQGQMSKLRNELKLVEKNVSKEMKVLDKVQAKKKKNKGTRAPSGFVKPTKISDELAVFLSKEKGALMARTDVTKEMTNYIREHKLQDKSNGRKIIPDQKLKKLLSIDDKVELTYFNLQKYMSPHFEKATAA